MTQPGTIVILNGASSSGKTTLLKLLQERLEEPYLNAGIDKFIWMLPERWLERPLWDDVLGLATTAGASRKPPILRHAPRHRRAQPGGQ